MEQNIIDFKDSVWDYYTSHSRELPWRQVDAAGKIDPYTVLVSEIMLQQTQVQRVIPKYHAFLSEFPDIRSLAEAPLDKVLAQWSGLGYNRRAKFLWQAAQEVMQQSDGSLPDDEAALVSLPGIGINTARAILVYAHNMPLVFIETNVRTVYIHHFFADHTAVHDREIMPLLDQTVDREHPREWYWALMDYGTHLKKTIGNASRQSAHYAKQSSFKGSKRQIRGQIIKLLLESPRQYDELKHEIGDGRFDEAARDLIAEQLIKMTDQTLSL